MKKPTLRVTKWLGDTPVEGCCTLCPETLFRVASAHHRPQKAEYIERLQRAFDRHVVCSPGTTPSQAANSRDLIQPFAHRLCEKARIVIVRRTSLRSR